MGKNNWALSADYDLTQTMLGYYWGIFIPLGEKHRFFKTGLGLTVEYVTLQSHLYICDEYEYKISDIQQTSPELEVGIVMVKYIDTGTMIVFHGVQWSILIFGKENLKFCLEHFIHNNQCWRDYSKDLTFKNRRSNNIYFS